jgi:hypothetical protein
MRKIPADVNFKESLPAVRDFVGNL